MRRLHRRRALTLTPMLVLALVVAGIALASGGGAQCVDPSTTEWTQDDTRPGGTVSFTKAYDGPRTYGPGSLELKTEALNTGAKAGLYNHTMLGLRLKKVYALTYWTYQAVTVPPNPPHAAASYQLQIDVNGEAAGGFTTMVFEPYQNGVVTPGTWQKWDVKAGLMWSSRTVTDVPTCALVAGGGGPPFYTLEQLKTMCPNAVVVGIGVNVGSNNPGYTVAVDAVELNSTTWDFECDCGRRD